MPQPKLSKGIVLKALLLLVVLVLAALSVFYIYVQIRTYPAEPEALERVLADERFFVYESRKVIIVTPHKAEMGQRSIIYYPGGLVDPKAYLYQASGLAGCLNTSVYIVRAPFNASIFAVYAAAAIIEEHQLDKPWVGGHSLGGIAAARFTANNPDLVGGLYLLGSYSDQDLTYFEGPVISIMGLNDQIINRENYEAAKTNLPPGAVVIEKAGLNHSLFGNYGLQQGDGPGGLTDEEVSALLCSYLSK